MMPHAVKVIVDKLNIALADKRADFIQKGCGDDTLASLENIQKDINLLEQLAIDHPNDDSLTYPDTHYDRIIAAIEEEEIVDRKVDTKGGLDTQ